jgi:hypothetical protein
MFASRTLTEHLLRGIVGIGAMIGAVAFAPLGWASLLLVPVGLVALRGCPMCWTIGLVQTVWARVRGESAPDACLDGSCRLDRRGAG